MDLFEHPVSGYRLRVTQLSTCTVKSLSGTREWIQLHHEDEVGGTCSTDARSEYCILAGKSQVKNKISETQTWEDNIKIYLREIRYESMDWILLTQDWVQSRVSVNRVINLLVP